MASDAVDAVILLRRIKIGNPEGFQIIVKVTISKI
jgi:hypothetical protein